MASARYEQLPTMVDLPALDHEMLAFWARERVFETSVARTADGPTFTFFDGPPTANGTPGAHHIEARAFKDLFPRYRTMKGEHVVRRAGWDCHGLPVELAVERELGFTGKGDIEAYGIAEFNARCRESVQRYVDQWKALTKRMGFWIDMDDAYWTMSPEYVESVWWSLKKIFDAGLLVPDHRVTPYCPRCGTGLSDHEVAQGYETVVDPSAFVRFPVLDGPLAELGAALLVWTTTPWTLVANTAAAVGADVDYVALRVPLAAPADGTDADAPTEVLVVADALRHTVLGVNGDPAVAAELPVVWRGTGADLVGLRYARPIDWVAFPADASPRTWTVLAADFVTTDEGSGLVHEAPAYGAEDLTLCRAAGLPVVNPIRGDGRFEADVPVVGGIFFKTADELVLAYLRERGLLLAQRNYEHAYPHCWRCHTPLMYYALPSWFIRTTAIRDRLLAQNEATTWQPDRIKHGRYGDWLSNNIDWALSRNRYWGTPLPIWRCPADHLTCVESLADLGRHAGRDLSALDPHRPFVDDVTFPCPQCGDTATRVPEVIDAWYDSGSMPFAQWGYPWRGREEFERAYPADFIAEAIDQTRGWFYTLMAVGTLVFDQSSYRTVLCLGHIVDDQGRKMSKHVGNVLDPFELFERHGADAVRWLMLCTGNPWATRRVGHAALEEIVRKVLLTTWHTASFLTLYGNAADWRPGADPAAEQRTTAMDRWALSSLATLVKDVDESLAGFDPARAGRRITEFVDDLSNWYVRSSRRRFWSGDPAALATLHTCVETVLTLLAPFTPFVADRLWQACVRSVKPDAPVSVHLAAWPTPVEADIDPTLDAQMATVRRVVELGRSARATGRVRVRQPLPRMLVSAPGWDGIGEELRAIVATSLNIADLGGLDSGGAVEVTVKANFRSLGRRFGKGTQPVAKAIAAADPAALAAAVRAGGATVDVAGEPVTIGPDDVVVSEAPKAGWAVQTDGPVSVALDLTVTPELAALGLARDAVRQVQEARKAADLDVSDRVALWWRSSNADVAAAIQQHEAMIAEETLAVRVERGAPTVPVPGTTDTDLGLEVWVERV